MCKLKVNVLQQHRDSDIKFQSIQILLFTSRLGWSTRHSSISPDIIFTLVFTWRGYLMKMALQDARDP